MRIIAAAVLVTCWGAVSCGNSGSSASPVPPAPLEVGWHDTGPAPVEVYGGLVVRATGPRQIELSTTGSTVPFSNLVLALSWNGGPLSVWRTVPATSQTDLALELEPPCDAAARLEGRLYVFGTFRTEVTALTADERLIGASWLNPSDFLNRSWLNFELVFERCLDPVKVEQGYVLLSDDPRLPMALCRSDDDTCRASVPREVRLQGARLSMTEAGVRLSATPALSPAGEPLSLTINGLTVATEWSVELSDLGPFHEGLNTVEWSLADRPAWRGTVVLPVGPLSPTLSPEVLEPGKEVEVSLEPPSWPDSYAVLITPSWPSKLQQTEQFERPPLRFTFLGWELPPSQPAEAEVHVSATRAKGAFSVSRTEVLRAPLSSK